MPGRSLIVVAAVVALGASACTDPAVRVSYRPAIGTRTSYEMRVNTSSTTKLIGEPRRDRHSFVLRSDQVVRNASRGADTQVAVRLSGAGQQPRDFVVRLDRAGQLATVETVEGVPSDALGNLGISELLPSAAGALRERRCGPATAGALANWCALARRPRDASWGGAGSPVSASRTAPSWP